MKYRVDGKEKQLSIGAYPEISLSEARKRRDEARELLARGQDPSLEKQRDKVRGRAEAENTFRIVANEYCAKRKRDGEKGWSTGTATRSEYLLSLLMPSIGRMAITDIEPADALARLPSRDLAVLYTGLVERAEALAAARSGGRPFRLPASAEELGRWRAALVECSRLEGEIASVTASIRKETRLARRVELGEKIHIFKASLDKCRGDLA